MSEKERTTLGPAIIAWDIIKNCFFLSKHKGIVIGA